MDEAVRLYESVLRDDVPGARRALEEYAWAHGLKEVPLLSAEHCLAVYQTLGQVGLGCFARRMIQAMACDPQADFWHRLFYYWGLRGSLGFLVTLELLDQLEAKALGTPLRHAPLRDLVISPSGNGDSLSSKRQRDVLRRVLSLPLRIDPDEASLYRLTLLAQRANLYAGGYWQRTACESLQQAVAEWDAARPALQSRPMLASLVIQHLLSGYAQLCQWAACDGLLERLRELPGADDDSTAWEAHIAECRGEKERAQQVLLDAQSRRRESLDYWHLRVAAAIRREDFAEAQDCLRRSIELARRKPHGYYRALGMCHYRLGNHAEAVRLWRGSGSPEWQKLADGLQQRLDSGQVAPRTSLVIPSVLQKPNHCGPCALAMIGRFWGLELSQEEIAEQLSPWGTYLCQLATLAEKRGMAAVFGSRDFDAVAAAAQAGYPVLLGFSYPGGGHFVIANGYDPNLDQLEIRDPGSTFTHLLSRKRYREEASYHDYLTAVICPPDKAAGVPPLALDEAVYRELAATQNESRTAQAICEGLRSRHTEQELAQFNSYADLRLRALLDDHQLDAARALAEEILRRHENSLYACSRVAEAFLRADRIQDAYDTVCRIASEDEDHQRQQRAGLDDLLGTERSPSHEYLEFIRARCALQLGNLQVAAVSLMRSINRFPVQGGKFLTLADLMGRLGEEGEQLKFLDIAQQISGPNARAALAELAILRRNEDYPAARALIDKTLEQFPDHHWLWLDKGQLCEEMRLHEEAAACYRRVCQALPDWHPGYTNLLGLLHRLQDRAAAQQVMGQLDQKMPGPDRFCVRAYWSSLERDWPAVLDLADRCLAEAPMHTWARSFRAQALEAQGRLEEAAAVWQWVVQQADPSDYYWDLAVASLGRLGRKLEDVSAFESAFQRAIEVAPDSPSLWAAMCDCFRYSGRSQDARRYFEALYARVTDKAGLAVTVGSLLIELRLLAEARAWFERIPPHNAAFPGAVRGIVGALREENRLEDAIALLRETAQRAPSSEVYSLLADSCLDRYQFAEAIQWVKRSLTEFPHSLPEAAYRLVRALEASGAIHEIEAILEFVMARQENLAGRPRSDLLLYAAYARKHLGQLDEAMEICRTVLEADRDSGPAWIVQAEIQQEAGQFDEAIASARKSCATRHAVYPFRRLFELLRDMGRIDEAFDVCIEGLELFPGELSFQELLDSLVLEFQMLDRYLEACRRLFPLIEDKASFLGNQGTVFWRLGDDARARQLYEQALQYGDRNWLHALLGGVLRSQGDFLSAERQLQAALQIDPHYTYAAERLAELYVDWYFAYGQVAESLPDDSDLPTREALLERIHRFYQQMAETLPNNDGFFRGYCQFCARLGDLAPAESLAEQYARESAVYSVVCCHLAEACETLHDADAAGHWLQRAVQSDEPEPFKAEAYLRMGWHTAGVLHDPDEALGWYRRAVRANQEEVRGYTSAADVLEEQGRMEEAMAELLAGLERVEDPSPLLAGLARTAVQAGRWETVQQAIAARLHHLAAREAALAWLEVAEGLADGYDYAQAQAVLDRSEATCPVPIALEATRLSVALKRREYQEAEEAALGVLELDADNQYGLYHSSRLALRRSDVPEALKFLQRFVKAGGTLPLGLTNYAYAAVEQGCVAELIEFCDACYTEREARGPIHLLNLYAHQLLGDQQTVRWLLDTLPDVDASRLADAHIMLAETLVNDRRYAEAPSHLARAIQLAPENQFARCLRVAVAYLLDDVEAGRSHARTILEDTRRDYWTMAALWKTVTEVYPDTRNEASRYRAFFEPFQDAASELRDRRKARPKLLSLALKWGLSDTAAQLVREALGDRPFPDEVPEMHEAAVAVGDLDLADQVLRAARSLHVHPVTVAQMQSISHALRGQLDQAIACAREARHGHGAEFSEMCMRLFQTGADLGDLCDTLFNCVRRYHEGHGPCSLWTLLLLWRHGRVERFEEGLAAIAAAVRDYRLEMESRRSLRAAVAAARLYRAQQAGQLDDAARIRVEIAAMPLFHCDVGNDLYRLLGLP